MGTVFIKTPQSWVCHERRVKVWVGSSVPHVEKNNVSYCHYFSDKHQGVMVPDIGRSPSACRYQFLLCYHNKFRCKMYWLNLYTFGVRVLIFMSDFRFVF